MDTRDTPDPTTPILTRRQLLRGASVGVGLYVVAAPPVRHVLGAPSASAATPGAGGTNGDGADPVGRATGLHGTIRGTSRVGASVVAAGNTLRFDPSRNTTLEVRGNLVVRGRLVMRPQPGVRHILRFVDVDESAFVGGGLDPLETDIGLWVMGNGRLDIKGTKKQAWNRLGDHATWRRQDDLVAAPVARGDFTPRRFRKGSRVPRAGNRRAEVLNLTRNARIEGTRGGRAHIFIRSNKPQSIRYAALRYLGPRQGGSGATESVLGRYGLHFHHCHNGSRGSVVEGVVVRDCGGHSFGPHMSDGIRIRSCIAYNVFEDAYWWDPDDATNDLVIDRCVAASVHFDPEIHGYRMAGFLLGKGRRLTVRDCVAFSVIGNGTSAGYVWPEAPSGLWKFKDNLAHNNAIAGIFVWQNVREPHKIDRFTAYRNGEAGIIHGAYLNSYHYRDLDLRDQTNAIELHAAGRPDHGGRPQSWVGVRGGDLHVRRHNLPGDSPVLFRGCSFPGGVTIEDDQGDPAPLDFVDCGLSPGDFRIGSMNPSTDVRVQRGDGSAYRLTPSGGSVDIHSLYPC
jgi:hypothetical protein